ncbi:hypothetical protein HNQ07_004578 [Deinococcus metalli]|uniref:Endonuclease n=1 Tax=Deinococcus metalli TaxID=1141878 RepID=A0A7W8NTF4_9DEIO|nr:hypothetical protein [Deinococcus metalli]MBB5379068.1 hypothetical protein [Deinococcus metalli]GHF64000.1 hypothetical protein GCM10017781_44930 [Deinococcus metalli]
MAISLHQVQRIKEAYAAGELDPGIAQSAGVSIATAKRYRQKLGLKTNSVTALRGEEGEQLVAEAARARGLSVVMRPTNNDKSDFVIQGQRVDVKATMQLADGSWRFRLPRERRSFYGGYTYPKDYAADCELVVLVALRAFGAPDFYLLPTHDLPLDVRIRAGGPYDVIRNDWSLLDMHLLALSA